MVNVTLRPTNESYTSQRVSVTVGRNALQHHVGILTIGFNDIQIMLGVLDLIDVVMIANLLIMVVMGGYETFVSKLNLHNHPDQPEWLDELDAGAMKIKLALALIGISSIHLLRTFIDPTKQTSNTVMWQVVIHLTLVFSALAIAYINRLLAKSHG